MYLLGVSSSQVSRQFSRPNPPVINSVSRINDNTVSISWSEGVPVPNNFPVTSVVVECYPVVRNLTIFQTGNPVVVTGDFQSLTAYKFTLRAVNIHGTGDKSLESEPILPVFRVTGGIGSSAGNPATSGYALAQANPTAPSGLYWIKSASMPSALQMYVDMSQEGGGYDFYPITNGTNVSYVTDNNSGKPLGLDIIYPRSSAHWTAIYNYVNSQLGGNFSAYLQTVGSVYRTATSVGGGNYTGYIMRSGSVPDWRVPDGGRWWLRDSTFSEPNGDYTFNGYLGLYGAGYSLNSNAPSGWNDGGTYSTGTSYIVSTNAKP